MTHLYLIRHGESWPNVEPIIGGMKGDRGLTPLGIQQAERLRDRLAEGREIAADVLIASTLPRARETAAIIQPALGLPILFDDQVQELQVGEADGLSTAEAHARFGVPDFEANPLRPIAPGGENWGQFMLRVGTALERIAREQQGKTVVVVCHGGVIDGSLIYFFGLPTLRLPEIRLLTHNTSITHWERYTPKRGKPPRWRLVCYNDIMHLREIGARESIHWDEVAPTPATGADTPAVPLPTEEGS